jgi:hypothetical protein
VCDNTERVATAERARYAAQAAAADAEQSRLLTEAEMRRARERIDALKTRLEMAQPAQPAHGGARADPLIGKFKCVARAWRAGVGFCIDACRTAYAGGRSRFAARAHPRMVRTRMARMCMCLLDDREAITGYDADQGRRGMQCVQVWG